MTLPPGNLPARRAGAGAGGINDGGGGILVDIDSGHHINMADFKPKAFTNCQDSWKYIEDIPHLPGTLAVLEKAPDKSMLLAFDTQDCHLIADIIEEEIRRLLP